MERSFIETEDGSSSLYVPGLNEHYHSIHGAIQESLHIFIRAGIEFYGQKNIRSGIRDRTECLSLTHPCRNAKLHHPLYHTRKIPSFGKGNQGFKLSFPLTLQTTGII